MSKHIKIRPGLYINLDAIAYTEPLLKNDVDIENYRNLFSLKELKAMGYTVRKPDKFVYTNSWKEAENAVAADPTKRAISHGCTGYTQLKGEDKETLVKEYLKYDYKNNRFIEVEGGLDPARGDEVLIYRLHLQVPCGGINNSHVQIDLRPDEFKIIEENIENS